MLLRDGYAPKRVTNTRDDKVDKTQASLEPSDGGESCRVAVRAAEREVTREWEWLHDALITVARVRAEQGDAAAFRLMQAQAMVVSQRRLELSMRIAEIEGPDRRA